MVIASSIAGMVGSGAQVSLFQCGVAIGLAPSGTMNNNGAITFGTNIHDASVIHNSGAYLYYPADVIAVGVPAGFYWTTWSSVTAATVYNNTYTPALNTKPTFLAAPTAFVTTGPGAFTGDAAGTDREIYTVDVPNIFTATTGALEICRDFTYSLGAPTKTSTLQIKNAPTESIVHASIPSSRTTSGKHDSFVSRFQANGVSRQRVVSVGQSVGSSTVSASSGINIPTDGTVPILRVKFFLSKQLTTGGPEFMLLNHFHIWAYL